MVDLCWSTTVNTSIKKEEKIKNITNGELIVGLKELRQNINKYVTKVNEGKNIIVLRRSKVLFKVVPVEEEWEEVVDFTRVRRGGVDIKDILSRL